MKTKTNPHFSTALKSFAPCSEAMAWLAKQPTAAKAWKNCERGDWMLWLLGNLSGEPGSDARRKLVLCACACARLALSHVAKGELRPLAAIEAAEAWASGSTLISIDDVRKTAYAADAAYAAASAAEAAYAAAYAADAAYAYAAAEAAHAAYAAASAAGSMTLKRCADIVRKYYPKCPKLGGAR